MKGLGESMSHSLQFIKTDYDLHRDPPRVLRMLLVCALTDRQPLDLVLTDERTGAVAHRVGLPTDIAAAKEFAAFRLADGGMIACRFWEIDALHLCADAAEGQVA
jgi:hypothetical protein